ncbi:MAG: hypothetical protein N2652_00565 [Kiritimatiellae bacterium]|nr:hypothetical protein [Kiritimatiellia bacterium]
MTTPQGSGWRWGAALGTLLALGAFAEEAKTVGTATLDLATAYLFRGATVTDTFVAQPSLKAEVLPGLTLFAWGNMDLDSDGGKYRTREFSEIDLSASWALPIEGPSVSVGYIEYMYPHADLGPDREVFASVGADVLLQPTLTVYWGLDGVVHRELYGEAAIAHSVDLVEGFALDLSALVAARSSDTRESGFSHAVLSAALRYEFVKAGVAWVPALDDDVLPDESHIREVVGTLSFSVNF